MKLPLCQGLTGSAAFLLLFVSCFHVVSLLVCCHSNRPLLTVHPNFMMIFVSFWSHQVQRESCIMNMRSQGGLAVEVLMHKETFVAAAASLLQFVLQRTSVIAPKQWGFLIGRGPLALIWAHWQSGMNSIRSQSWCNAWNNIADCGVILICTAAEARVFLRRSLTLVLKAAETVALLVYSLESGRFWAAGVPHTLCFSILCSVLILLTLVQNK